MASRKEQKERLRTQRLAAESAERSAEQRRRTVQLASLAVLGVAVLAVIVIAIASGGGGGGGDAGNIEGTAHVNDLLKGLDQQGTVIGDPDAKVTIVEFGDLQCPVCKQFSDAQIPELIDGPVRDGDANLEFRNWVILTPFDGESGDAARAALAAGEQGRYWQFVELFYTNQGPENTGYVTDDFLEAVARAAGVPDLEKWNSDRGDTSRWASVLTQTDDEAQRLGFSGTPSVAIESGGELQPVGAGAIPSTQQIEQAVRAAG